MTSVLRELFRHKAWATLRLIEYCQRLEPAHLEATLPGTYGSVRGTLVHLANTDEVYYAALTQQPRAEPLAPDAPLEAVAARIRELAPRWEALLDDPDLPDRELRARQGVARGVAAIAQSVHHADDHRSQVLSILGARGLDVPTLDIWAFGTQAGFVNYPAPAVSHDAGPRG